MNRPTCTRLLGPPLSRHRCNEPAAYLQRWYGPWGYEERAVCKSCREWANGQGDVGGVFIALDLAA